MLVCVLVRLHVCILMYICVKNGWTAAMLASREGNEGCLRMLIAAGANMDSKDQVYDCEYGLSLMGKVVEFA